MTTNFAGNTGQRDDDTTDNVKSAGRLTDRNSYNNRRWRMTDDNLPAYRFDVVHPPTDRTAAAFSSCLANRSNSPASSSFLQRRPVRNPKTRTWPFFASFTNTRALTALINAYNFCKTIIRGARRAFLNTG